MLRNITPHLVTLTCAIIGLKSQNWWIVSLAVALTVARIAYGFKRKEA